jgi:hypothetical protein
VELTRPGVQKTGRACILILSRRSPHRPKGSSTTRRSFNSGARVVPTGDCQTVGLGAGNRFSDDPGAFQKLVAANWNARAGLDQQRTARLNIMMARDGYLSPFDTSLHAASGFYLDPKGTPRDAPGLRHELGRVASSRSSLPTLACVKTLPQCRDACECQTTVSVYDGSELEVSDIFESTSIFPNVTPSRVCHYTT